MLLGGSGAPPHSALEEPAPLDCPALVLLALGRLAALALHAGHDAQVCPSKQIQGSERSNSQVQHPTLMARRISFSADMRAMQQEFKSGSGLECVMMSRLHLRHACVVMPKSVHVGGVFYTIIYMHQDTIRAHRTSYECKIVLTPRPRPLAMVGSDAQGRL
jgi:hypothetical protein